MTNRKRRDEADQPSRFQMYANGALSPPCNPDAEAALLGALMFDNGQVDEIRHLLEPSDFFFPINQRIFSRILHIVSRGQLASPVTLRPYFEGETIAVPNDDGESQPYPVIRHMLDMVNMVAALTGVREFARQVRDLSVMRKLIAAGTKMVDAALDQEGDFNPDVLLAEAEAEIFDIAGTADVDRVDASYFGAAFEDVMSGVKDQSDGAPPDGVCLDGYGDFQQIVGPMERGDLILLGGRPSMGKTGVGCKVAVCAARAGFVSEILSLEMDKRRVTRRCLADMLYRPGYTSGFANLVSGKLTTADYRALDDVRAEIEDIPLHIEAPRSMMVENLGPWIRKRQRAWKAKGKELRLLVLDYMGRMQCIKVFRSTSERVAYISNEIKRAARDTGVTIVALTQLSRALEAREDKHPILSDLRDSGDLEQDADVVVFVYRDEYYLERHKPTGKGKNAAQIEEDYRTDCGRAKDRIELYTAKRRDGALERITGYYFASHQAIRDKGFLGEERSFFDE